MSNTTERIFMEAAAAGVSVSEYLAAMQSLQDQAIEAFLMDNGQMIIDMDIEDAEIEELCDGNL